MSPTASRTWPDHRGWRWTEPHADPWIGLKAVDIDGRRIGRVTDVFLCSQTAEPVWILIRFGKRRGDSALCPVDGVIAAESRLWIPCTRELISRGAPLASPAAGISKRRELELCLHYGLFRHRRHAIGGLAPGQVTAISMTRAGPDSFLVEAARRPAGGGASPEEL